MEENIFFNMAIQRKRKIDRQITGKKDRQKNRQKERKIERFP